MINLRNCQQLSSRDPDSPKFVLDTLNLGKQFSLINMISVRIMIVLQLNILKMCFVLFPL